MDEKKSEDRKVFSQEELRKVLEGVKDLSKEELGKVFAGYVSGAGDDRTEFTLDAGEIERDIFGSKMAE